MKPNKDPLKNEEERKDRSRSSYSELPEDDDSSPTKVKKKEPKKAGKETREIRILKRSKTLKEKNDPERFSGDGVNFKAKIIGIEHVFDARGNRMCQGALQRLKAAVKTSGDHKQRIVLNISLCGIKIKDEKSGEDLHHHPIHKISFISQDTSDSRAFGYVFGCPQSGHRFFGIKTEKTASQVVVTLRDLFHTALELKKQEMEKAMDMSKESEDQAEHETHQNGETEGHYNGIAESAASNGAFGDSDFSRTEREIPQELLYLNTVMLPEETETRRAPEKAPPQASALDNLLDLQLEMDTLQQGITQMENSIATAASQGFGISFSEDDVSVSSGSSFPMTPRKIKETMDRLASLYQDALSISSRSSSTSDYNICSQDNKPEESDTMRNDLAANIQSPKTVESEEQPLPEEEEEEEEPAPNPPVEDRYAVFLDIDSIPSIFDSPNVVDHGSSEEYSGVVYSKDFTSENSDTSLEIKTSTPVVFAELDPLGNHPFVDKKNFFQDIKNPPKKVLKDFAENSSEFSDSFSESDAPPAYEESSGLVDKFNPFVQPPFPHIPPKLPPKRSASIASPLAFFPTALTNDDDNAMLENPAAWEVKNPFNPFVQPCDEFEDLPPPSSPPPPPPPRLPMKCNEAPPMSPPPPRPPSRSSGIPTPPLPKRKPPISSAGKTWFSFDQDATAYPPVFQTQEPDSSPDFFAPPIPAPSRKFPTTASKIESKSSSSSNSPGSVRRPLSQSPRFGASSLSREIPEKQSNGIVPCSPRKMLTRHSSIAQETITVSESGFKDHFFESDFCREPTIADYTQAIEALNRSPPLPPKPSSISRPRPSPSKKMLATPCTSRSSSNASTTETTNGTCSSSSLVYSSVDDSSKHGSSSEGLLLNSSGSQSAEAATSVSSNGTTEVPQSDLSPMSPDSIFRRKDDPFADDFFLTLPKKGGVRSESCPIESSTEKPWANGVDVHLEHL